MLVSIIIPAHNAASRLADCLEACLNQTYPETEVIVVDDGSFDATPAIADRPGVRCLRQNQMGPAAARNHGAREAKGKILVFTDSDCLPASDWVERLVEALGEDDGAAGGGYVTAVKNPPLLTRLIQEEITIRHEKYASEVDFLGSYNLALTRKAFESIGGFDEDFRAASAEDNDLAYRLADAGFPLRYAPGAIVAHYHPEHLWPYLRTQARHGFWRVLLYTKHPRRMHRGDRYAGKVDMYAPALSLVLLTLCVGIPILTPAPTYIRAIWAAACGCVAIGYLSLRLPMAICMAMKTRSPRMLEFADLAFMRDIARGFGMMRGFWHFLILRKGVP